METINDSSNHAETPPRREFIKGLLAVGIGTAAGLIPVSVGVAVLCDTLRQRAGTGQEFVRATVLDSLPPDGVPRKFVISATQTDAWNKYPSSPIGAVYLRRTGESTVEAFNAICPHAGCFVDYLPESHDYLCPCHRSRFALDGKVLDPASPSPRGMDGLKVEIRNGAEVWVHFQNYAAGKKEQIPVA